MRNEDVISAINYAFESMKYSRLSDNSFGKAMQYIPPELRDEIKTPMDLIRVCADHYEIPPLDQLKRESEQ